MCLAVHWGQSLNKSSLNPSINFFYDDKLAALSVENVKVNNVSIEDALNVILKGKNISYKVEDNIVYLSEKTATSQEGKQQGERADYYRSRIR